MKNTIRVLGIDPSGNENGTTGYTLIEYYPDEQRCKLVQHYTVCGKDYDDRLCYWSDCIAHMLHTATKHNACISIEDYVLYKTAMGAQSYSDMPTSKLIGAMTMYASVRDLSVFLRTASVVKKRWANHILENEGLVSLKNRRVYSTAGLMCAHEVDALRHALHCAYFEASSDKAPVNEQVQRKGNQCINLKLL